VKEKKKEQSTQLYNTKIGPELIKLIKNVIMLVPVTVGIALTLNAGRMLVTTPRVDSISTSLSASGADMGSYHDEVSRRTDELYAQLKRGEITGSEFSTEYSKLTSERSIESWARESNDSQVQSIVAKYDQDAENCYRAAKASLGYFYGGMSILGLSAIASVGVENYLKKKYGVNESFVESSDEMVFEN
jgi:hypothetical protein